MSDSGDDRIYVVLVNDEGQYSLWLKDLTIPAGWRSTGQEGAKDACARYVDEVWTDMRPLSLQRAMKRSLQS